MNIFVGSLYEILNISVIRSLWDNAGWKLETRHTHSYTQGQKNAWKEKHTDRQTQKVRHVTHSIPAYHKQNKRIYNI